MREKHEALGSELSDGLGAEIDFDVVEKQQIEIARLRKALGRIERWFGEFPETGKFWDDDKDRPMSYGAAYGSNGERDYMRSVARDALRSA